MVTWAFFKRLQHCIIGLAILVACSACSPAFNSSRSKKSSASTASSIVYSMLSFLFVDWDVRAGIGYQPYGAASNSGVQLISFNSKLYSFWTEGGQVHVSVYNGDDSAPSWTSLDGGLSDGINANIAVSAGTVSVAVFNSELYGMWIESGVVKVAKYNGDDSAPSWTFVDAGGLNYDLSRVADTPALSVMDNTTMFAVWNELDAGGIRQIRVSSYNGAVWTLVDGAGVAGINFAPGGEGRLSHKPAICLNSKLYVTWQEMFGGNTRVHLKVYDPAGPSWSWADGGTNAGLNYDPTQFGTSPLVETINSKIYVFWDETDVALVTHLRATAFNPIGSTRTRIDGAGAAGLNMDPTKAAGFSDVFIFASTLYITWIERNAATVNQLRMASFNGNDVTPTWTFADGGGVNGINDDIAAYGGLFYAAVHAGKLYSSWGENGQTFVRVYNGDDGAPVWTKVLSQRRNIGLNNNPRYALTPGNMVGYGGLLYTIYTGFDEANVVYNTVLKVFNGNDTSPSWTVISINDGNINYDPTRTAGNPDAVLFNSKIYATWDEENPTNQIRVLEYNPVGGTTTFVDGNGVNGINFNPARYAYNPKLVVVGSKLYNVWIEDNTGVATFQLRAAEFDPSGPSWTRIDGNGVNGLNYNPADAIQSGSGTPKAVEFNSKLYVAWAEYKGGTTDQIRVRVYDPVGATWTFIDGNGVNGLNYDATHAAIYPDLAVFNSKLYAIWQEDDGSGKNQIRVKVYNGNDSSPSWTTVGGGALGGINYSATNHAQTPKLVVFNSNLYATWSEQALGGGSAYQIRIAQYSGLDSVPAWQMVDSSTNTGINHDITKWGLRPKPLSYNSKLYLFWYENNGNAFQGRVARAL